MRAAAPRAPSALAARRALAPTPRAARAAPPARPSRAGLHVEAAIKATSKRSVVKVAQLEAADGQSDAVRALCLAHVQTVATVKTRNKKLGVVTFDCSEDPFAPGVFHFWERYDTAAAMAAFCSSDTQQSFEKKVLPLVKDGIGMMLYEWSDGKLGATALPIGPKGEGGLDDATGQSGGAQHMQTSATMDIGALHKNREEDSFGLKAALGMAAKMAAKLSGSAKAR